MTNQERDLERMTQVRKLIEEMSPEFRREVFRIFSEMAGEMRLLKLELSPKETRTFNLGQIAGTINKRLSEREPAPGAWDEPKNIVMEVTRELIGATHEQMPNTHIH